MPLYISRKRSSDLKSDTVLSYLTIDAVVAFDKPGIAIEHAQEASDLILRCRRLELAKRLNLVHARGDLAVAHSMAQELDLRLAENTLLGLEHQSKTGYPGEDLLKVLVVFLLGLTACAQIINLEIPQKFMQTQSE